MAEYIKREDVLALGRPALTTYSILDPDLEYISARDVMKLPVADVVERKKGKWEDVVSDDNEFLIHACSVCGHGYHMSFDFNGNIYFYNFCPHCGADMRGEDDV